jgi:hypothetical protein
MCGPDPQRSLPAKMANVLLVPEPACRNFGGENVSAAKDRRGFAPEIHDNPSLPRRWEIKTGHGRRPRLNFVTDL